MGNIIVSTENLAIYYPSDWLIEGGATFESMSCPPSLVHASDGGDVEPLQIIYNKDTKFFGVTHNGFVVMEAKNAADVAKYVQEYVQEFQEWVAQHDVEQPQ